MKTMETINLIKEVSAWAVVSPEKEILLWTSSSFKYDAVLKYIGAGYDWARSEAKGYSCIEVTIKPKEKV